MVVEVGVRELRSKLSYWLDRVARGEQVIVTERGRPRARLTAVGWRETRTRLIEGGLITPAKKSRRPVDVEGLPTMREGSLSDIVVEQRRSSRY